MFRAIRFSAVLGFDIEEQTFKAIRDNAEQIRHISVERLKTEMDKLFTGDNPVKAFTVYRKYRITFTSASFSNRQ